MGVPKFFRWLSERYPLINQRYHAPYEHKSDGDHSDSDSEGDSKKPRKTSIMSNPEDILQNATLAPEIDRLYIDMNGIIHGCSHNNSEEDGSVTAITEEEIFKNITTYLDRIIGDIIQPKQLVYMAIDGVAPRAKLNQQRSRRYRSGTGNEIEQTVYEAHLEKLQQERRETDALQAFESQLMTENDHDTIMVDILEADPMAGGQLLKEVTPGRYSGKFETHLGGEHQPQTLQDPNLFHSNSITPGTPFFKKCTDHLESFIKDKLANDPKWKHLTIIFSGPNVPGEGEHKIMDFMRRQKQKPDYDPNLRHCIQGQDGDLIMLGLVTHEPNLVLLREQVIFDARRRMTIQGLGIDAYVHNPNFEFLHMNVLRDYLAFDFETSNVVANSPYDLERTIDDFVFMTFFVGNDFLPGMPALDIADEAFDLLWYTYREHREKWYEESKATGVEPYLTDSGNIVSGKRLEAFLSEVGSFESPYFDNKKEVEKETNQRIRKADAKYGQETIPSEDVLELKEAADRASFRKMMLEKKEAMEANGGFNAVLSSDVFQPRDRKDDDQLEPGLSKRLGSLLQQSVATGSSEDDPYGFVVDDQDLKGRYYYDKFKFTPYDADSHQALRKAYIEGLVWTLKYYYEGCASWSWYYPYHYGPMLSDLVGIDKMLIEVSFDLGEPLMPFEQLMACMPPSQAHVLPEPYRPLMTSPDSTIIDFYPQAFTVDMNGKRWPWEAVVLLPFIDTKRLLDCTRKITEDQLTPEERDRNKLGEVWVMWNDSANAADESASVKSERFESTKWEGETAVFQPALRSGTKVPLPGLPTLRSAPIRSLWRRRLGINVFGLRSRYKTACLEHSESMPRLPPLETLGQSLIGSTVWINFPHLTEAFVTGISDENFCMRGREGLQTQSKRDKMAWVVRRDELVEEYERGEGFTGTGGLVIPPDQDILLSVRPLKGLRKMSDGTVVKTFSKSEIEVPIISTLWAPTKADPRLGVPALLEKNPYKIFNKPGKKDRKKLPSDDDDDSSKGGKVGKQTISTSSESPDLEAKAAAQAVASDKQDMFAAVNETKKQWIKGSTNGSQTTVSQGHDRRLVSDSYKSKRGKNGTSSNAVQTNDPPESIRSTKRKSKQNGGGLDLFPPTPSHEDVWVPVPEMEMEQGALSSQSGESFNLFPLKPSHEDVWKPLPVNITTNNTSAEGQPTKEQGSSTDKWWETAAYKKNEIDSRPFSTVSHREQRKIGRSSQLLAAKVRPYSTLVSRQTSLARGRGKVMAAGVAAAALFFASGANAANMFGVVGTRHPEHEGVSGVNWLDSLDSIRGGGDSWISNQEGSRNGYNAESRTVPPLEFEHGTTTLSFAFQGGAIVAVDSRASMGSFVGSKTVQKVLPINSHMLGTMAGGAADCSVLIRSLRSEAMRFELEEGYRISTARVSQLLARVLYKNRGAGLSVGTMIVGYDDLPSHIEASPQIYYVDDSGTRLKGNMFSAGSGSTFALAILDTEFRHDMTEEEAVALGIKAIRYATLRDAFSGGFINVYVVTPNGWKKVFTEDVAVVGNETLVDSTKS